MALILTALHELYGRLLSDPGVQIPKPGYCAGNAAVVLEISRDGRIVRAVPIGTQKGKRVLPARFDVPDRVKRTSGDAANFLCDNAEYLLGANGSEPSPSAQERAIRRHELAKNLHKKILGDVADDGAGAVLSFLENWAPEAYWTDERLGQVREILDSGANIVFRLAGDDRFVHDRPSVMRAWEAYASSGDADAKTGQCLVTGECGPIAPLHKSISGVVGAKSTGATLVSFNIQAFESYGKTQGANAPVGAGAAFSYATALNWLASNERHRLLAGDTTIVFWAERAGPEENLLLDLFANTVGSYQQSEKEGSETGPFNDEGSTGKVKSLLERIMRGLDVSEETARFDQGVRFYILGLAPNSARISIRFWHVDTFGTLLERVRRHFDDMAIERREGERPVTVGRLLLETAPSVDRKRDKIPQVLVGPLMQAVLEGTMYPQSLYATLIRRIRSDFNDPKQPRLERKVTYPRASYLKAHLKRKARIMGDRTMEEALTEMLNPENKNEGYVLGRLFALLEKAQQDANPGINATIKDRYYASASATPVAVFPVLLRLAQHHIAKSEYGGYVDKQIEGVMSDINSFPTHLNLDQQGLFALGYYQQRSALYKKAGQKEEGR